MLKFEAPRIEIEQLSVEDVLTTSTCDGYDPNAGEDDEW